MAGVVHYGSICTQGLNCDLAIPKGNRELAEYAELTHDPLGLIHIALSEDNPNAGSAFTWYTKQTAGPGVLRNVGSGAGFFNIGTGTGNFGLLIESHKLSGTSLREGTLTYLDTSANVLLSDTAGFSSVSLGTNTIQVAGTGTLENGSTVNFTATATAGGPGAGSFAISWPGYSASGTLVQGQVVK